MGEVHTGLMHNSVAVSAALATKLVDVVLGERVRRFDRPVSFVVSPDRFTGVDCQLATASGPRIRGIGTVCARATITGGHIVQGSAHVRIRKGDTDRREPWSHYLARPGVVETTASPDIAALAGGFLAQGAPDGHLDLGAIGRRAIDAVQDRHELDHVAAFRTRRTQLRWVVTSAEHVGFRVLENSVRTLRLPYLGAAHQDVVELCEDLARHDFLLTTLLDQIGRSGIGAGPRSEVVGRLRPAIDFLLHLWMPAARVDQLLAGVWQAVEQRPGLSRQWQVNVDRIRDQLALEAIEKLGSRPHRIEEPDDLG